MMGIIGSAAGWRTHVDLAAFADMQPEVNELQAAMQWLELMQQQIAQSVYASNSQFLKHDLADGDAELLHVYLYEFRSI